MDDISVVVKLTITKHAYGEYWYGLLYDDGSADSGHVEADTIQEAVSLIRQKIVVDLIR